MFWNNTKLYPLPANSAISQKNEAMKINQFSVHLCKLFISKRKLSFKRNMNTEEIRENTTKWALLFVFLKANVPKFVKLLSFPSQQIYTARRKEHQHLRWYWGKNSRNKSRLSLALLKLANLGHFFIANEQFTRKCPK